MLKIEVSYRAILLLALMLVSLWALTKLWPIILLIVTAFIFHAALLPYVEWLVRKGLPRTLSVLAILLAILGALAGLSAVVVPAMVDEFRDLRDDLPQDAQDLEEFLDDFGIKVELSQRAEDIDWDNLISGQAAVDYGQRALTVLLGAITVFVLTAYLLVDTPRLSRFVYQFVPPGREPDVEHFMTAMSRVVGGYIRGQIVTSACIFVYTLIVLLAAGVPNALAFAVLAAFVDIIPLIGATIAVVFPTIAAFQESPTKAIIVLALLLLYQQFEDRFLTPRVYGQTLNLPPLVVLVAVLVGGQLLGIAGVLLAMPAAAVARVGFDYWMEKQGPVAVPAGPADEVLAPDEGTAEKESTGGGRRSRRRKV
ncbi:MAG TPA: AI-2E family transporter [Dehalococcoidia bacterium]|nr:AI-2E family transporter [Dehalococcoidia bacterium]